MSIDAARQGWINALNDGSAEEFGECVARDAVWLPSRGEAVEGRTAIVEWLQPLFDQFRYEFAVRSPHVRRVGDWAIEEGDFRSVLHRRSSGGEPLLHDGRYLLMWRRVTGTWRIDRYVDRTDARPRP